MGIELLPQTILSTYEVREWRHACAILKEDFPNEWNDIVEVLESFTLNKSYIVSPGGRKSPISNYIDDFLYQRDWEEKSFDTKILIDDLEHETPTHKIDCLKNRVALEIEWNNKDPFFDRDLNNFRLLFELGAISVGVIITRCSGLQKIFNELGKGKSYGNSTTHMDKLVPRIEGGGGGGCPILVLGISEQLYREDI
ncbi:BglII/BstYI family type II restriction endonuclease [Halobacillus sp. Cin3]|uniref:BglII/BstYI family type II restriction endonuclease n=1 Tax=Halobacillus sp. Cin3 TaxID=2928441 RepID=UPI00248EDAF0|nr:BglII/BstYI family type II restriction endonuclease [Halobacillus sp. Cin3]